MGFNVGDRGYYMSHTGTFDTPPKIYPFTVIEHGRRSTLVLMDGKTKPSYADTAFCYETLQEAYSMVESKTHKMIEDSYKKLVLMKEMYGDML